MNKQIDKTMYWELTEMLSQWRDNGRNLQPKRSMNRSPLTKVKSFFKKILFKT